MNNAVERSVYPTPARCSSSTAEPGRHAVGVVRALDIDSGYGAATHVGLFLAEHFVRLGRAGHPALGRDSYVISNRRIASLVSGWNWRGYTGSNPHISHTHVSVALNPVGYDTSRSWELAGGSPPPSPARPIAPPSARGRSGPWCGSCSGSSTAGTRGCRRWSRTASFGSGTEARVMYFQRRARIAADGIVEPITWARLENPA